MRRHGPYLTLIATGLFLITMIVVSHVQAGSDVRGAAYGAPAASSPAASATSSNAPPSTAARSSSTTTPSTVPSRFPQRAVYTGVTSDPGTSIALAVRGSAVLAYVCDGKSLESWLTGTAQAGVVDLHSRKGNTARGERNGRTVAGRLVVEGRRLTFTATLTRPPGGLYTATAKRTQKRLTWIVRGDGTQTGVAVDDGTGSAAPRLDPDTRAARVGGERVTAVPVPGDFPPPT